MNTHAVVTAEQSEKIDIQLKNMEHGFLAALPPHIPVERFIRVVLTAVRSDKALLEANRLSLFEAAMRAAQDGLLPDKREGAFVMFKGTVQWMPMIGGIIKKMHNSGEILSITANIAYENDKFTYRLGDEESITHEALIIGDRGKPVVVYAIAKTKEGGIYREVMTVAEIEKVRNVSRSKDKGPWVQWWEEMAKKTVIRRLSKRLPMSSDLDDLIRRDDSLYNFEDAQNLTERRFNTITNPLSEIKPVALEKPAEDEDGLDDAYSLDAETPSDADGEYSDEGPSASELQSAETILSDASRKGQNALMAAWAVLSNDVRKIMKARLDSEFKKTATLVDAKEGVTNATSDEIMQMSGGR